MPHTEIKGPRDCILSGETKKCVTYNCNREAAEGKVRCKRHAGVFNTKRTCKIERCDKLDVGGGRCRGHGGGPRCKTEGCTRASAGKGYCINHGGGRRCQAPNCNRSVQGGGALCKSHGGGMRCSQPNCNRSAQGTSSNCIKHGGGTRCFYEGCKRLVRRKGFCQEHLNTSNPTESATSCPAFPKTFSEPLKICPQNPLMILCGMTQLEDHQEMWKGENKLFPQHCIELLVPGMMCEQNCAATVIKFLKTIVGIRDVAVDFPKRLVSIQVLPEFAPLLSAEYCIKALNTIGFQAESCAVLRNKFLQQECEFERPPGNTGLPKPLHWNGAAPLQHNGAFETFHAGYSTMLLCSCEETYLCPDCPVHGMFPPIMEHITSQYQEHDSLLRKNSTLESIAEGCAMLFGGSCSCGSNCRCSNCPTHPR